MFAENPKNGAAMLTNHNIRVARLSTYLIVEQLRCEVDDGLVGSIVFAEQNFAWIALRVMVVESFQK